MSIFGNLYSQIKEAAEIKSQYQNTFFSNPLIVEQPQYRTGDKYFGETYDKRYTRPVDNIGQFYNDYIAEHSPPDLLAEFFGAKG